jgi:O-antigen ligase
MEVVFLLVLIIRSSLDIFTDIGFYIGPMKVNVASTASILILLMGLYFILRRRIEINKISIIFGIWLLALVPFVFISVNNFGAKGFVGLREWIRLFTIFMIFLLSCNLIKRNNIQRLLNLVFLSLVVPLCIGGYQLVTSSGRVIAGIHRIHGTFGHPNSFAFYLVLFTGLTCWKLATSKNKLWFLLLLLEVVSLITTVSLTGFVMFYVLFFILFLGAVGKQKIAIIFLVSLFSLMAILSPQFQKRQVKLKKIDIRQTIKTKKPVESFTWRIVNWHELLTLWRDKPIMGHGLKSTSFINPRKKSTGSGQTGRAPHSDFLRYLIETGLVGFSFYLAFVILIGYQIYLAYKTSTDKELKSCLYILLAMFLAWQIGSLAANLIVMTAFQYYFWAVSGFAISRSCTPERI